MASLKESLRGGGVVLGTFVFEFATPGIGRLAAAAGAQFILFDAEHTGWGWETLATLVATTRPTGAEAFIRVPSAERSYLSRALDIGATGLMIPMVESAVQARDIVRWTTYPPQGVRGAAFGVAHDDYVQHDCVDYMRRSNADHLLMAQIETMQGLAAVDEIVEVEGIDVLWVGQYDLTNSMGIPGQFDHPDYLAALDRVSAAAKGAGKWAGQMPTTVAEAKMLQQRGFRVLAYSGDLWLYQAALADGLNRVRGSL
jgi:2-dehydro-3-deoxyglucarate aldolase/4-hydroxy-2-oxoheptanedioate aldolase